jgi:cell division protein YceG involved in septum cleavage
LKKLIVLVLLLASCGYAGSQGYDWLNQQVRTPISARSQPVTVHIDAGESPDQLAQDLQAKGLIRNRDVFRSPTSSRTASPARRRCSSRRATRSS